MRQPNRWCCCAHRPTGATRVHKSGLRSRAQARGSSARPMRQPSRWCCCDHSGGGSVKMLSPVPRGSWPATAALTSAGARKASEIVMLTCRLLQFSRTAIASVPATEPAMISDNHRRPKAMARTRVARRSARMGRRSSLMPSLNLMISRRLVEHGRDHAMQISSQVAARGLGRPKTMGCSPRQ